MSNIQPYKIAVPQAKLDRLNAKLELADFPDELEDSGWDRGSPLGDIKRLVARWRNGYDWRKAEAELNKLPHFTIDVPIEGFETLKIHFVHQKSECRNAIPLLFAHGWPGSYDEVKKILPELIQAGKAHPAFHVVAPSMANFGFSEGTKKKGFGAKQHAEVFHKIMLALGYDQYVTQGGDIGHPVTRAMGLFYPQHCKASHTNMPVPNPPSLSEHKDLYFEVNQQGPTEADKTDLERMKWFQTEGMGYNLEQSTKPQTIGYSMIDSPVGLLAWIYEKLHDWTDSYPWQDDEVLTWVSINQFSTAGPHASQRIYYERMHGDKELRPRLTGYIPDVKLGTVKFPKELFCFPKSWQPTMGPVVLQTQYDKGGHFAAWERPDAIVKDLREMMGQQGGAFAVVQGRTGFD